MADLQSVQQVPQGLLEILGMKGTGQNPRTLDSAMQANADVRQMLALSRLASPASGFTSGAVGTAVEVTVPQNEWWVLLTAAGIVRVDDAATVLLSGVVEVRFGAIGRLAVSQGTLIRQGTSALPVGQLRTIPFCAPYPLVLRPGGGISCRIDNLLSGATAEAAIQVNVGVFS